MVVAGIPDLHSSGLKQMCDEVGVMDIRSFGSFFTWCNQQEGNSRIYCKLDRVLTNLQWCDQFQSGKVSFSQHLWSDHALALLEMKAEETPRKPPFRLLDMWRKHDQFASVVQQSWTSPTVATHPLLLLVGKQKRLKQTLKEFNHDFFSDITNRVKEAHSRFTAASKDLLLDPFN